ncbi:MAG TPA: hypothetical protein PK812_08645 [Beijerinckiaceae bacterium]|nr:hypothetical protein [Beijerinckiaceae bacterium]
MPVSLMFFAATAILFVFQLIPFTGVFLMMLAAPFWSIALVNAGFVGVGVEAALGKVNRAWLLLPLAWFAGYSYFAAQSRQEAERVRQDMLAGNAKGTLAFNPKTDDFVAGEGRADLPSVADTLIANYDIPTVFEKFGSTSGFGHRVRRFATGAVCDQLTERLKGGLDTNFAVWPFRENNAPVAGACIHYHPGDPGPRAFQMTSAKTAWSRMLARFTVTTLTITAPTGEGVTRSFGQAAVLGWLPMPVIGCALISAGPSWSCTAEFWRSTIRLPANEYEPILAARVVASALGLQPSRAATRVATAAPVLPAQVAKTFEDVEAAALKKLDQVLARDRAALNYTMHDMTPIRDKPALWRSRMDRMADFFVENFNRRADGRGIPEVINTLFEVMPPEDFRRYATRLAEVVRQRPAGACDQGRAVLARIGEAGASALPAIEIVATQNPGRDCMLFLVQSICRIGPAAERMVPYVKTVFGQFTPQHNGHFYFASYRALMRLGHGDYVRSHVQPTRNTREQRLMKELDTITPGSPTTVCV